VPTETVTDSMTNSGDTTAPAEAEETTEAQTAGTTETTGTTGTAETTVTAEADADVQPTDAEPVERSVREIYREALDNLHDHNMLPDGDEADTTLGDIEENQFAIFDVDGDGRDELIIRIAASAPMAGMVEMVYDVNEQGELFTELTAFPSLAYYADGHVTVDISHNQGYAGDFWPYTLLQYDKTKDAWEQVAFVDAMDKSLMEQSGAADLYPDDADTSGSGVVYYIGSDTPVDATEYQAWYDAWHSQTQQIDVPYQELTMDNIELATSWEQYR
ncbi:MAG: hypothetical protein K2I93_06115, partial [Oscillospiraceae bacterium]|nr:hypothetical protein [Oscillospiraceae bacterium]